MALLEDIQAAAVDGRSDLGTVLRKCKLLASRLGSRPLEDWLLWESNGYLDNIPVPDYRVWPLALKGHFGGYFGAGIQNAPIPLVTIPERYRGKYERYECRQSIASIEATLNQGGSAKGKGTITVNTGNLSILLRGDVYENYNCIQAWGEFSPGQLFELLNVVRNRILDFALAIWKESPTAGELGTESSAKIDVAHVTQVFQTTVYGGSATLVGTPLNSPITLTIVNGDFNSLQQALLQQRVPSADIEKLRLALSDDVHPSTKESLGPKVSSWIGSMVKKAAEGTWKVGLEVAGKVLSDAILKYYGLN